MWMVFGELYCYGAAWKFKVVKVGTGDLDMLAVKSGRFGIDFAALMICGFDSEVQR
jgi:hypothetical protein